VVGMEKDILVILMVAFGLFAIVMFILFFIYLKKYYNSKHISEDYKKQIDDDAIEEIEEISDTPPVSVVVPPVESIEPHIEEVPLIDDLENDMEFIPVKKK
jgi:flagellar basal body-associated protein FliL